MARNPNLTESIARRLAIKDTKSLYDAKVSQQKKEADSKFSMKEYATKAQIDNVYDMAVERLKGLNKTQKSKLSNLSLEDYQNLLKQVNTANSWFATDSTDKKVSDNAKDILKKYGLL